MTDYAADSNGPGYISGDRPDLTDVDTAGPDYKQEATVPRDSETHAGEDVAIYAGGPGRIFSCNKICY